MIIQENGDGGFSAAQENCGEGFSAMGGDDGMAFRLRPLKMINMLAFALHVGSIVIMIAITALQVPLRNIFWLTSWPSGAEFVMPSAIYVATVVVILVMHAALAVGFFRIMAGEYACAGKLNAVAVVALVFVIILRPTIDTVSLHVNHRLLFRHGTDHAVEALTMMNMLSWGMAVRNVALLLLLVGASMALYFCYLRRGRAQLDYMRACFDTNAECERGQL